jgi:hypothetical protein
VTDAKSAAQRGFGLIWKASPAVSSLKPSEWGLSRHRNAWAARAGGNVTLRTGGKLYHIGIGRTYAGTCVLLLAQDLHVRVINAATGELLRDLTLDPTRSYQPTGRPPGPPPRTPRRHKAPNPSCRFGVIPMSCKITRRPRQDSNLRTRLRRPLLYPLSYGGFRAEKRVSARNQALDQPAQHRHGALPG